MKFKSNDKKINQYMIHAVEIKSFKDGKLVEFERGLDAGYAIFTDEKVIEIFVRDKREFTEFKADRNIDDIIEEFNEEWLINKI